MKLLRLLLVALMAMPAAIPVQGGLAQAATGDAQETELLDPIAIEAVNRMGAYLGTLDAFTVQADITMDEVLESGQKLQFDSHAAFMVQRPDRLRVDTESDRQQRQMYFDGKTFTLYSPVLHFYAQVPAPPSIGELLQVAAEKYGIEIPLADLFYWGSDPDDKAQLTGAMVVGPALVAGIQCTQYAFRQPGIDWQVWIEEGMTPLPRKLVITTTDEPSQPQYVVQYTWDPQAQFDAGVFAFVPPANTFSITLTEIGTTAKTVQ